MKRKIFPTLAAAAMAMTASMGATSQAEAAAIVTSGTAITGVTGIDYNGTLYDATFNFGSCNALFNSCNPSTFAFNTQAEAAGIASALGSSVNLAALVAGGDTLGPCSSANSSCPLLTPYNISGGNVLAEATILDVSTRSMRGPVASDVSLSGTTLYATWTAAPEPSSAALLVAGAVATVAATRRRKKRC